MAEGSTRHDRRKRPRVPLNGEVQGKIHTVTAAPVIDLSEHGALLEIPCALRPGSLYTLRIPFGEGEEISLRTRVVRCYVHGFERKPSGEAGVRYRTAVEFIALSEREHALLQRRMVEFGGSFDAEFGETAVGDE